MKKRSYEVWTGDFETVVFDGQEYTEVWSSALCRLEDRETIVHHSIAETYDWLVNRKKNIMIYYTNLKFDGYFWLDYIMHHTSLTLAAKEKDGRVVKMMEQKHMTTSTYKYMISDLGRWYSIIIRTAKGYYIELRDTLNLLPFSVASLADAFRTSVKKLDMEYRGKRYAGCPISEEEMNYIKNDVIITAEAMNEMHKRGYTEMTIGSNCIKEYRKMLDEEETLLFPDLKSVKAQGTGNDLSCDAFIRKAYHGGWCYLADGKEGLHERGVTYDVNSLYPSMMHSDSGNVYPVGLPIWFKGKPPKEAKKKDSFFYVHIRCSFEIKDGYLPFIQIKGDIRYKSTECLKTSRIRYRNNLYDRIVLKDGTVKTAITDLYLAKNELTLFFKHYDVSNLEWLGGCRFYARAGLFDAYIDKFKRIKETSTGVERTIAKLFSNNLYGKFATGDDSSFKVAFPRDDGTLGFYTVEEHDKDVIYIAAGAAVTAYAREYTIRAAQKNWHGPDRDGFIYADTDSIHMTGKVRGIRIHDKKYGYWKKESEWKRGVFVRQKTYLEESDTHIDIKCAGLPEKCKRYFRDSVTGEYDENCYGKQTEVIKKFVREKREITDFKAGLVIPGKLVPVKIPGGIILKDTTFEIKGRA